MLFLGAIENRSGVAILLGGLLLLLGFAAAACRLARARRTGWAAGCALAPVLATAGLIGRVDAGCAFLLIMNLCAVTTGWLAGQTPPR